MGAAPAAQPSGEMTFEQGDDPVEPPRRPKV
jgi:hypothetical protein